MIIKVRQFGNSKGIIFPKQILAMCSIDDRVSVNVEGNHVIITPVSKIRAGWEAQFKAANGMPDKPGNDFLEGIQNEFDKNEWTWE